MANSAETPVKKKRQRGCRFYKNSSGNIELLLIQTVDHLGKQGDVVAVRPGFAFNFLLPQGLATVATDHHKRMIAKHKEKLDAIARVRMAKLQALADEISRTSINIEANANDEGHLYGSVGTADISSALKQRGMPITTDQVRLQGPLKELGLYTVKIHLGHEIEGDLKVWVVPTVTEEAAGS